MTDCSQLRIAFAGTPDFAASALDAILQTRHSVVAVLTQPDRPAGRGRQLHESPVKQLAKQHGLTIQQPQTLKTAEAQEALAAVKADVMVVAAYGLLLPKAVLSIPALGCLNIHASLLPRWRGAAPIQRAIAAGDQQTGVCIMQMDEGLDTGDVLYEVSTPITEDTTGGQLHDTLAQLGAQAIVDSLEQHCNGALVAKPQDDTQATYAHKLSKKEAKLNFSKSAVELHRQIRAFNPWPVSETSCKGERIRIWESALPEPKKGDAANKIEASQLAAGSVVAVTDKAVRVQTGSGCLDLLKLQRDGKKPMLAADFCRGMPMLDQVFV